MSDFWTLVTQPLGKIESVFQTSLVFERPLYCKKLDPQKLVKYKYTKSDWFKKDTQHQMKDIIKAEAVTHNRKKEKVKIKSIWKINKTKRNKCEQIFSR